MKHRGELTYFCQQVMALRQMHHLSKQDMASIMGIGVKRLNRIEQLDFPESLDATALVYLSDYFQIPIQDLFAPPR